MSSTNSTTRITVAQVAAQVAAQGQAITTQGEAITQIASAVTALTQALTNGQFASPAAVVSEITDAPSVRPVPAGVKPVSLKTAAKKVAEGGDAWKIHVTSSEGNVVPFGVVLRAQKAAERKANKDAGVVTAPKASKPANKFFAMSGADLIADGSKGAKAEIARREAKRSAKK